MTRLAVLACVAAVAAAGFLIWRGRQARPENQRPGKHPEELVWVRAADDVANGGAMFVPPRAVAKPVAVIWIHGWGVNFYSPTYVGIGRSLVERGYATITANTRMHDIGNVLKYAWGKRVRGGGYWGVASEEVRDLAAWVNFAAEQGFSRVVLVGHSAGWAAVRAYQAQTQDERVVGVVLASGQVKAAGDQPAPELLEQAKKLVSDGRGDELVKLPRSFPSYVSAATYVDVFSAPAEYMDFFGMKSGQAGVGKIRCPLLAFFGEKEPEIGTEEDLKQLKAAVGRLGAGPRRVDTAMIGGGDHMYVGQEAQVAQTIAGWADRI